MGHGPIQDFLAASAREHGVWLIGGSLPLWADSPDKVLNSSLVYNPHGQRVARYDKIHLFGFRQGAEAYDESATIEAGRQPVAFSTPFGRVGLSICYDLRFPELYRALGVTDLLVIPAAFTETTGRAHWEILLRARAIENQCYVLAVAQGGRHENGRETHGNSMLDRSLGDDHRPQAEGTGSRHRRPRARSPGRNPGQPAGAQTPRHVSAPASQPTPHPTMESQ
jgi:predicted amidohydrolase